MSVDYNHASTILPNSELYPVTTKTEKNLLLIEPFYGGSHKELIDTLWQWLDRSESNFKVTLLTLPAKKWHWRARTSALYLSQVIPFSVNYHVLFSSSVLNLTELVALRPDLMTSRKIVYFHENQLAYPVSHTRDRDFQFGYNQITTCIVADTVIFNSIFNRDTFLNSINKFMKLQPDFRPKKIRDAIEPKCKVLYFPINFPILDSSNVVQDDSKLHIIWPHRWEHDKDPETFFNALSALVDQQKTFQLSLLGENFSEIPLIFEEAKIKFKEHIHHFGYLKSKEEYLTLLQRGHVVVSTAKHEYYGVAMLESVYCGCFPLCPNNLVYPEIYPKQCLYNNVHQLVKRLAHFCDKPSASRIEAAKLNIDFSKYRSSDLLPEYETLFHDTAILQMNSG